MSRLRCGWMAGGGGGARMDRRAVKAGSVAVAAIAMTLSGCSSSEANHPGNTGGSSISSAVETRSTHEAEAAGSRGCQAPSKSVLPQWAGAVMSTPSAPRAHLTGSQGRIVAVPFGWPLQGGAKSDPDRANKILWIARSSGSGPLRIKAVDQKSGMEVTRVLTDGPGPSYVTMPRPGCWKFNLSWSGQTDHLFVRYY